MATSLTAHGWRPSPLPVMGGLTLGGIEGTVEYVSARAEGYEQALIGQLLDVLQPDFSRYVQVKIRCVNVDYGATPFPVRGWHYDHVTDYLDPRPHERHAMFTTGIPTLFRPVADDLDHIYATEPGRIYTYGRVMHKVSYATRSQRRLFIRVSEGDVVRPHNRMDVVRPHNRMERQR